MDEVDYRLKIEKKIINVKTLKHSIHVAYEGMNAKNKIQNEIRGMIRSNQTENELELVKTIN